MRILEVIDRSFRCLREFKKIYYRVFQASRIYPVIVLIFFFIVPITCFGESLIFSIFNKIYNYDSLKKELTIKHTYKGIISANFHKYQDTYIFIKKDSANISLSYYDGNIFHDKLIGQFSDIILNNEYAIFIGNYCTKQGKIEYTLAQISINKTDGNTFKFKTLKVFEIDLILNDFLFDKNKVYLSGTNKSSSKNILYAIDIANNSIDNIFHAKKDRDFIKLINKNPGFFIYNSSIPDKNNQKYLYSYINNENNKFTSIDLKKENKIKDLTFFGKGFVSKERIYLPLIGNDYSTYIVSFLFNKKIMSIKIFPVQYGIYHLLKITDVSVFYIGYNYFKESGTFYLVEFNYASGTEKLLSKIPL